MAVKYVKPTEFAKYLQQSGVEACRTLPAVTNLVEYLTKFGWKKGEDC